MLASPWGGLETSCMIILMGHKEYELCTSRKPKLSTDPVIVTQHVPFAFQSINSTQLPFLLYFVPFKSSIRIIYLNTTIMASSPLPQAIPSTDEVSSAPINKDTPKITQPSTQTDNENAPIPDTTPSINPPEVEPDPKTPAQVAKTLPDGGEGEEKHDWEVVNASPSHSPSKDGVNEGPNIKSKARDREKSNNSTFGKDGKIGQKIDGVKKVLKSGVFGQLSLPEGGQSQS